MTIITQQSFRNGNSEQKNVKVHRKSVSVLALCNNLLSKQKGKMDTIVSFWLLKTIWNQPGKWCRKTFDKHENQLRERKRLLTSHGWTFALGLQYFFHFSTFALRDWHLHWVYNIIFNFWLNMNHLPRWFGLKYLALGMICWEDCSCLLRHRSRDQSSFLCVVWCIILDEDNGNIWV